MAEAFGMIRFMCGFALFLSVGDSRLFPPGEQYKHLIVAAVAIFLVLWGILGMGGKHARKALAMIRVFIASVIILVTAYLRMDGTITDMTTVVAMVVGLLTLFSGLFAMEARGHFSGQ